MEAVKSIEQDFQLMDGRFGFIWSLRDYKKQQDYLAVGFSMKFYMKMEHAKKPLAPRNLIPWCNGNLN